MSNFPVFLLNSLNSPRFSCLEKLITRFPVSLCRGHPDEICRRHTTLRNSFLFLNRVLVSPCGDILIYPGVVPSHFRKQGCKLTNVVNSHCWNIYYCRISIMGNIVQFKRYWCGRIYRQNCIASLNNFCPRIGICIGNILLAEGLSPFRDVTLSRCIGGSRGSAWRMPP